MLLPCFKAWKLKRSDFLAAPIKLLNHLFNIIGAQMTEFSFKSNFS